MKVEADFEEIREEIEKVISKQDGFDRLDYFVEIRKLYSLLQALYKGGSMVSNSNVMAKMPKDLMHDHFNRLIQMVFTTCGMAVEMRDIVENLEPETEETSLEEVPDKELHVFSESEIPYVV